MRVMYTPQTRWWPHDYTRCTHDATVPAHPSLRHGVQRLALPASRSGRAAPAPLPLSSRLELRGTSTGLHSTLCVTLPSAIASHRAESTRPSSRRAGRCRGLCRYRDLLDLKVHVRIPTLKNSAQLSVERPYSRL